MSEALGLLVVVSSGTKQDLDSAELDVIVRTNPLKAIFCGNFHVPSFYIGDM
jgi:hypothetical protein